MNSLQLKRWATSPEHGECLRLSAQVLGGCAPMLAALFGSWTFWQALFHAAKSKDEGTP